MKNRISGYFFYALGEIILVVISILIALQINNWNEERKALKKEKELVEQLLADAIADSVFYDSREKLFKAQNDAYNHFLGLCNRPSRTEDSIPIEPYQRPFIKAAFESTLLSNNPEAYQNLSNSKLKRELRFYHQAYEFVEKATQLMNSEAQKQGNYLIVRYGDLDRLDDEPVNWNLYRKYCRDEYLKGRLELLAKSSRIGMSQIIRMKSSNKNLISELRSYLKQGD